MKQVTMTPVEVCFTEPLNVNLFLIDELSKFTEVRVLFVLRDCLSLRGTEPIDVVGKDATRKVGLNRLMHRAPPMFIITLGGIAE